MQQPVFPDVAVLLPDPRLPDATKVGGVFPPEDLEALAKVRAALGELGSYRFTFHDDHEQLIDAVRNGAMRFALNLCDTGFRNFAAHEPHVPALLEMFGVEYTGSPPGCLALCYDKANVRAIAVDAGVAVPRQRRLGVGAAVDAAGVPLPALVKPNRADGGVGITVESVVETPAALVARVERLQRELPGQELLIQEFLTGPEYGITLLGNPAVDGACWALPPMVVDWSGLPEGLPRILGYESKTLPDSPYWTRLRYRRADLPAGVLDGLVADSTVLFERLGCRDYARFDWRADAAGEPRLLEVNPNPAWCDDGKMNLMAGFAGIGYSELFGEILAAAQRRVASTAG